MSDERCEHMFDNGSPCQLPAGHTEFHRWYAARAAAPPVEPQWECVVCHRDVAESARVAHEMANPGHGWSSPDPVAGLREALDAYEREWLDSTPPAGHPLIHGIFQRLPDRLAALLDEPVPPKSYWMEFLEWESQAAAQGSGMTAEQKTGAAIFRSWLVNHAPDDGRPEKVAEPVSLDWRETYLRTLMNEIRGVIADSEDEPEAVKRIAARLTDPKGATDGE